MNNNHSIAGFLISRQIIVPGTLLTATENFLILCHQVAFILLFTSQFTVLIIIFVHWTQLLEYWTHDPNYVF